MRLLADQQDTGSLGDLGPPSPSIPGRRQRGEGPTTQEACRLVGLRDGCDTGSGEEWTEAGWDCQGLATAAHVLWGLDGLSTLGGLLCCQEPLLLLLRQNQP